MIGGGCGHRLIFHCSLRYGGGFGLSILSLLSVRCWFGRCGWRWFRLTISFVCLGRRVWAFRFAVVFAFSYLVFRARWVLGLTGPPQHYLGSQRQGLAPKRNHCERHRTKSETAANGTGPNETTGNQPTDHPRKEGAYP